MSYIFDFVTAVTAVVAVILSGYATLAARKSQIETRRLQKESTNLAARQAALSERAWTDEFFRDVTQWASETAHAISRAIHLPGGATRGDPIVESLLAELSAAIDTGRWYFPNQFHEKMGLHKPPAYRGARQRILDHVMGAYNVVAKLTGKDRHDKLVNFQRWFVSEVQLVLDPRGRDTVIAKVLREFGEAERIRALKAQDGQQ